MQIARHNLGLVLGAAAITARLEAVLYDKVIKTSLGPVQGYQYFTNQTELETYFGVSSSNVANFLGIPFAVSTAYQSRWKAPQPREPWNETLVADTWGAPCPSRGVAGYSEDCLNLNVWTSANSSTDKLPVIAWNQGSDETSDNAWWCGGRMALQHDIIVVTFNRRDDAFGFLAHPNLNAESLAENGHNSSGNWGILDHKAALEWAQSNIANFGGDQDRVTIVGQSFGSSQVYHAVNSALFSLVPFLSLVTAISAGYPLIFKPVLDDYVLPEKYMDQLRQGPANDVPLITGGNNDENSASPTNSYEASYVDEVCALKWANLSSQYFNLYPTGNTTTSANAAWNLATLDLGTVSQWMYATDRVVRSNATAPMWTCLWDHAPPGQEQGAFHQSEIMYVLNALYANSDTYPFVDDDFYIQSMVSAYWANFVKTCNPNYGDSYGSSSNASLPYWAPNTAETRTMFNIGDSFRNISLAGNDTIGSATADAKVSLIQQY
ncbi:hypothetical protein FJTKL_09180 [Diaporthe vaccinii]|uniref:Carboxylesterase type B domain-containing protein n=1 Tax=Diaporthe vaccinii TaxID=105482 RepID=A0ABR4EP51_9PEZI